MLQVTLCHQHDQQNVWILYLETYLKKYIENHVQKLLLYLIYDDDDERNETIAWRLAFSIQPYTEYLSVKYNNVLLPITIDFKAIFWLQIVRTLYLHNNMLKAEEGIYYVKDYAVWR